MIGSLTLLISTYFSYTWLTNKPKAYKKHTPTKTLSPLVEVIKVKKINTNIHIKTYGTVTPFRTQTLSSRVSSQITHLLPNLITGNIIKKGELLIELDPTDYILKLKEKAASLASAKLALETEIENQKSAIFEFSMIENNISKSEKNYLLRYPHIKAAKANLDAQKAAYEKAKLDLDRCKIYAPFNAIVLKVMAASGDIVNSSSSLATLVRADTFWIRVAVPPKTLKGINIPNYNAKTGSKVSIRHDFWTKDIASIQGKVQSVEKMVDENSKMAYLLIVVKDPLSLKKTTKEHRLLFINEFVHLNIQGKLLKDILKVPLSALRNNDSIWVLGTDKKLHIKKILKVWQEKEYFYINANALKEGESIITSIIKAPTEGMNLRILEDKNISSTHKKWKQKEAE